MMDARLKPIKNGWLVYCGSPDCGERLGSLSRVAPGIYSWRPPKGFAKRADGVYKMPHREPRREQPIRVIEKQPDGTTSFKRTRLPLAEGTQFRVGGTQRSREYFFASSSAVITTEKPVSILCPGDHGIPIVVVIRPPKP
jgi:hypothetical protein